MAAAPSQDSEQSAKLFAKAKEALLDLFDTNETMLISNQSLRVLIEGFSTTLEQAFKNGTEEKLFERWKNQMPEAKNRLLAEAKREPIRLVSEREIPILSEDKGANFLRMCPRAPEPF